MAAMTGLLPVTAHASGLAGTITTVAGGMSGSIPALSSNMFPMGLARDAAGNVYVADLGDNIVRRIDTSGSITTVAGDDSIGFSGDGGPATQAQLDSPTGVALDPTGQYLYIADSANNRVRRVDLGTGIITTFAGGGSLPVDNSLTGPEPATDAELDSPQRLAVDSSGDLYISDVNKNEVLKVDTSGDISVYAGTGSSGYSGDGGAATNATFNELGGLAVMPDGSLLIADSYNNRIRRVSAGTGIVTTVAGDGSASNSGDSGPAVDAGVDNPVDVASDAAGGFWIAEANGAAIRHVDSTGTITTAAVSGLARPQGVAFAGPGAVVISDVTARHVLLQTSQGTTVIGGNGTSDFSGENVPAVDASVYSPMGVGFDAAGNMYIADEVPYRIRRVAPSGVITTLAGSGAAPCQSTTCDPNDNGDGGPALDATLYAPNSIAVDPQGDVYFTEAESTRVREVNTQGIISTVAGLGTNPGDDGVGDGGPAIDATLNTASGVAIAPDGALVIADTLDNRIRRVDPQTGIITTIAGDGTAGSSGDGGAATSAELNEPTDVAFDGNGDLFIADFGNGKVREVSPGGTITTAAGNGFEPGTIEALELAEKGVQNGTPAIAATLDEPYGVAADPQGDVFIADQGAQRVFEADTSGDIWNVAGTGTFGYSGDGGPASSAALYWPAGMAVYGGGLYIADSENHRIRAIDAVPPANTPESPAAAVLPLVGVAAAILVASARRRRRQRTWVR